MKESEIQVRILFYVDDDGNKMYDFESMAEQFEIELSKLDKSVVVMCSVETKENEKPNFNPNPVKVSLGINLTAYDISCILSGCFEGGSNYWINKVEIGEEYDKDYKGFASDYLDHEDRCLLIHGDHTWKLNAENMVKGYGLYCEAKNKIVSHDNMDAGDYDSILQYALFGELIYG